MPFDYTIDAQRQLVVLKPDRPPVLADWVDVLDRAAADPQFRRGFNFLSDRRHITVEPGSDYVRGSIEAIADRHEQFGDSRWAIVTTHLASYGMARMAEAYADNRGIAFRVFMSEADALAWLGEGRS